MQTRFPGFRQSASFLPSVGTATPSFQSGVGFISKSAHSHAKILLKQSVNSISGKKSNVYTAKNKNHRPKRKPIYKFIPQNQKQINKKYQYYKF